MHDLDAAVSLAQRADPISGLRLVGVDGPSGAGKTTFARALADRLRAPVIETDDFIVWNDYESWWPRFEEQVLRPLTAGQDAVHQVRDWTGDEFGLGLAGWRTVPWAPLIVIEGVTSTRAAASSAYAVRIWVEVADDVRLRRGLERDGEDHRALWTTSIALESAFFAEDRIRDRAHVVIDGARPA